MARGSRGRIKGRKMSHAVGAVGYEYTFEIDVPGQIVLGFFSRKSLRGQGGTILLRC